MIWLDLGPGVGGGDGAVRHIMKMVLGGLLQINSKGSQMLSGEIATFFCMQMNL